MSNKSLASSVYLIEIKYPILKGIFFVIRQSLFMG